MNKEEMKIVNRHRDDAVSDGHDKFSQNLVHFRTFPELIWFLPGIFQNER